MKHSVLGLVICSLIWPSMCYGQNKTALPSDNVKPDITRLWLDQHTLIPTPFKPNFNPAKPVVLPRGWDLSIFSEDATRFDQTQWEDNSVFFGFGKRARRFRSRHGRINVTVFKFGDASVQALFGSRMVGIGFRFDIKNH